MGMTERMTEPMIGRLRSWRPGVAICVLAVLSACAGATQTGTGQSGMGDAAAVADTTSGMAAIAEGLDPSAESDPFEAEYLRRFQALAQAAAGVGLGGYDPLEAVPGAADYAPLPRGPAQGVDPAALKAVEDYVAVRNSNAFMVWQDSKVVAERYFGDHGADDLVVSRSLAKPLTVLAVGRAIALGYIESLDQSVADFITEWQGTDYAKIKVRHLLDMRSGLLPQGLATEPEHILNRAYLHPKHDEVIIKEYPLTHEPGTRYEYSNATSELVAPLIERATGQRYGPFVSQQVLAPIGAAGGQVWVNREGGTAHSGCCILLPAETYLRFAVLLMQDGMWNGTRLLPEGYVAAARTANPQNLWSGMGLYVAGPYTQRRGYANPETMAVGQVLHSEPYLDADLFLYDGNGNQVVYMIPSANMIVLRTGARPPAELPEWDNAFIPNTLLRAMTWSAQRPEPEPQPRS